MISSLPLAPFRSTQRAIFLRASIRVNSHWPSSEPVTLCLMAYSLKSMMIRLSIANWALAHPRMFGQWIFRADSESAALVAMTTTWRPRQNGPHHNSASGNRPGNCGNHVRSADVTMSRRVWTVVIVSIITAVAGERRLTQAVRRQPKFCRKKLLTAAADCCNITT